ncbi:MAG: trypsin-like peptidase domain-containing protein [Patescibacteria group bacterium]
MTKKDKFVFKIITSALFLVGVFYFNIKEFQNIQSDISRINNIIENQQLGLKNINEEISQLQKINEEGLNKLKTELSAETEKRIAVEEKQKQEKEISQKHILDLEQKMIDADTADTAEKNNLTNIIEQWKVYVVAVECDFYTEENELFAQTSGSGLLVEWQNTSSAILTNKHIVTAMSLGLSDVANQCVIKFPKKDILIASENISVLTDDFDWGLITINSQDEYVDELMQTPPFLCVEKPLLGDRVAIIGYPNIGDAENVTVTDGIISGFDENYFITSAKVEKGNSGGAAISLKNNCYLGTPTFSKAGIIESMARILDAKVLFE